jgi:hypothetical protein
LKFDLKIYHPHNCVHALLADWKKWVVEIMGFSEKDAERKALSEQTAQWATRAEQFLFLLQTTLATVLYRPLSLAVYSIIALGNNHSISPWF